MRFNSSGPAPSPGGNISTAPTRGVLGERHLECPKTGLRFAELSQGVWSRGRLLHPRAVDDLGYREFVQQYPPDPRPDPREPALSFSGL